MNGRFAFVCLVGSLSASAGCYYSPQTKGVKANPAYLSEAEAEELIQKKLAPYGLKFVSNMKLKRDDAVFVADGYDRAMCVGFEYRSHEGFDFEPAESAEGDGLSDQEIGHLDERQLPFREFFLIVSEGPREAVEQSVDEFVKNLYTWEVLKKPRAVEKKDELFPEKNKTAEEMLPWESTKDLRQKRKEMESKEKTKEDSGENIDDEEAWRRQEKGEVANPKEEEKEKEESWPVKEEKKEDQVDDSDFDF